MTLLILRAQWYIGIRIYVRIIKHEQIWYLDELHFRGLRHGEILQKGCPILETHVLLLRSWDITL